MFQRVLLPVDLTDKNEAALVAGTELLSEGGTLVLLHVIESIVDAPFEDLQDFYQRLEEKARGAMSAMAETVTAESVDVQRHVIYGRRAPEIVSFAEANDVDLVIVTSRSLDPAQPQAAWASIGHQVAVLARCPVLLLK